MFTSAARWVQKMKRPRKCTQKQDIELSDSLRLSIQRALWDNITPNLMQASADWHDATSTIWMYFYYASEPTELDIELAEDAAGYAAADFSEDTHIEVETIDLRMDPLPKKHLATAYRVWELERRDPGIRDRESRGPVATLEDPEHSEYLPGFFYLHCLYALLGRVTQNLLRVGHRWDAEIRCFELFFYYEEEPTDQEKALSEQVASDVLKSLPEGIQVKFERCVGLPSSGKEDVFLMTKYQGGFH